MKKKTIAVIFGGRSAEHDVSIITAHTPIIGALQASGRYDVWPIYISPDGSWYADKAMSDMSFFTEGKHLREFARYKKARLLFDNGLNIVWPGIRPQSVRIDVVFPAMHGTFGEDGSLMGLLRMAQVPFVGCDLFASAIAMDKALTKQIISAEGIPTVPFVWFTRAEWGKEKEVWQKRAAALRFPVFVKPVHLGSSIAITKVKSEDALERAVDVALHYDDKALVEESVEDLIEVTLPIMGNDTLRLGAIERPLNRTEFFDFEDKYLSGGKKGRGGGGVNNAYSEIPARISSELAAEVEDYGRRTYRALGCSGIARIDFLIDGAQNKVYVNEVNTLPGSLYHHNWRSVGVSSLELVETLIELAEERFADEGKTTRAFTSSILRHTGAKTRSHRAESEGNGA